MACPCEHKAKGGKSCKAGTPPVLKVESVECPVLFHTVNIPASVGTVETLPPTPGAYRNARVTYEADEVSYLYDSDGIPQLLSNGGSSAVESVNGKTGVVVLDANDVGAQPTLTAGANVQITDNTISATDTTYTAGTNISIDADNVISATDTTYSDFVGTDGVDAGSAGLVPAPATTDADKFLKSDGTWAEAGGGTLYTTYGQNTDGAMTQKATTDLVYTAGDPKKINIGDNGAIGGTNSIIIGSEDSGTITAATDQIIIGHNITDSKANTTVIGHGASVSGGYSISIGEKTTANSNAIAIGNRAYASFDSIAIGPHEASASGQYSVQIGKGQASGNRSIHISTNDLYEATQVAGEESIGIGRTTIASTAPRSVVIGNTAAASSTATVGVAIGDSSKVSDTAGVAIGSGAKCEYKYSVGLGSISKPRAQGVVDIAIHSTYNVFGYQGVNDQDRTNLRVISGVHDGELATDAATVSQAVGTTETYTIADTDWVALSGANPYTYSVDVTAATTIGANTICELFNDDAVTFATYGFAIGAVNSQTVTIYSVGAPTSPVTLTINYKG